MEIPNILAAYRMKSTNSSGEVVKVNWYVYADGVVTVQQLVLSSKSTNPLFEKLCTKFGKNLYENRMGFKLGTLHSILDTALKTLKENNIPPANIKR